jgi:hypothetical protein
MSRRIPIGGVLLAGLCACSGSNDAGSNEAPVETGSVIFSDLKDTFYDGPGIQVRFYAMLSTQTFALYAASAGEPTPRELSRLGDAKPSSVVHLACVGSVDAPIRGSGPIMLSGIDTMDAPCAFEVTGYPKDGSVASIQTTEGSVQISAQIRRRTDNALVGTYTNSAGTHIVVTNSNDDGVTFSLATTSPLYSSGNLSGWGGTKGLFLDKGSIVSLSWPGPFATEIEMNDAAGTTYAVLPVAADDGKTFEIRILDPINTNPDPAGTLSGVPGTYTKD